MLLTKILFGTSDIDSRINNWLFDQKGFKGFKIIDIKFSFCINNDIRETSVLIIYEETLYNEDKEAEI